MSVIKLLWSSIYGQKSHLNLAGKVCIGIPIFPFVAIWCLFISFWVLVDFLFMKKD